MNRAPYTLGQIHKAYQLAIISRWPSLRVRFDDTVDLLARPTLIIRIAGPGLKLQVIREINIGSAMTCPDLEKFVAFDLEHLGHQIENSYRNFQPPIAIARHTFKQPAMRTQ